MKKTVFNGNAEQTSPDMSAEGIRYGIELGRRAPMHRMHVDCILEMIRAGLVPVIGIGSINGAESPLYDPVRNPLTVEQQKEQFRQALPAVAYNEAQMIMLEDTADDKTWFDNFAKAMDDAGITGKAVVHFRSKSADAQNANDPIKPLSQYTAAFVEKGIAVWQSCNSNPADDKISGSEIRGYDLAHLTPAQRGVIAAPDYLISLARKARADNPDKALLEQHKVPLTVLDLALDRMRAEAGIRTADVLAAALEEGPVTPASLTAAATEAVRTSRSTAPGASKRPVLVLGSSVSDDTAVFLKTAGLFNVAGASIGKFQSDEPFVEVFYGDKKNFAANAEKIKGAKVFIVQSMGEPVADHIVHTQLMIHTLKFYGAAEVTAVVPFLALSREDRAFDEGFWSVGADLMARQLKAAGADNVTTFTMHSQGGAKFYEDVFGDKFKALSATEIFAAHLRTVFRDQAASLVVGAPDGADKPDDEGQRRARALAASLTGAFNEASLFEIGKEHVEKSETKIVSFKGDVAGKDCVIVDDLVDGGSTLVNAARLLKQKGAKSVTCDFTHAILTKKDNMTALERLMTAMEGDSYVIDRLVMTDAIPEAAAKVAAFAKQYPQLAQKIEILSLGPAILGEVKKQLLAIPATAPANSNTAQPAAKKPGAAL